MSLKITTPTDRPDLAENLSEASVPARARSNRRDLQPSGDRVASDLDTRPSQPRQILIATAPPCSQHNRDSPTRVLLNNQATDRLAKIFEAGIAVWPWF